MVEAGSRGRGGAPLPRRRAQTLLFIFAIVGIAAATAVGFVLARADAQTAVEDEAGQAAQQAAGSIETTLATSIASIAGAGLAVGPEGDLDTAAFEGFAADLLAIGEVRNLALLGEEPAGSGRFVVVAEASADPGGPTVGDDHSGDPV